MKSLLTISGIVSLILLSQYSSAAPLPSCISKQFGNTPINNNDVVINAPEIAENGAVVGVGITEVKNVPTGHYVQQVSLFNEFRSEPVATFHFSENVSPANMKTRIRLRESSNLFAVAKLDNGALLGGQRHIKVTIGGCGGGDASESIKAERVCTK